MEFKVKDEQIKSITIELGNCSDNWKEVTFEYYNGTLLDVNITPPNALKTKKTTLESTKNISVDNCTTETKNPSEGEKTDKSTVLDKALDYLSKKDENGHTKFSMILQLADEHKMKSKRKMDRRKINLYYQKEYERLLEEAAQELKEAEVNGD